MSGSNALGCLRAVRWLPKSCANFRSKESVKSALDDNHLFHESTSRSVAWSERCCAANSSEPLYNDEFNRSSRSYSCEVGARRVS